MQLQLCKSIYKRVESTQNKAHTSLLNGGYLPRPGVAFAAAETISTRTRCTFLIINRNFISCKAFDRIDKERINKFHIAVV